MPEETNEDQAEAAETVGARLGRWLAVALVLGLLALGVYLIDGLERARRADDCLSGTDRRCRQIPTR